LGADLYRAQDRDGNRDHAGIYGAYSTVGAKVDHNILDFRVQGGTLDVTSYTLGAYWTHFWPKGAYVDAVAQISWHELEMNAQRLATAHPDGKSFALSLEGGYPFDLGKIRVEPQAQLIYQNFSIDAFSDGAATIRYNDLDSLVGRVGVRIVTTGPIAVWLRANLWYEFQGHPMTEVSSADGYVPFRSDLQRVTGQFGGGLTMPIARRVVLYGSAHYDTTFDGKGSGWDGRIGLRINW
jgi:outer membrane autotransporter protein